MRINIKESSTVQPAQNTPKCNLWMSSLDFLLARVHMPTVYFYKSSGSSNFFRAQLLKESLSKALVLYYPVAGRLGYDENGRIEIQCNAKGVSFAEAETDSSIEDFVDFMPGLETLQLTPKVDYSGHISSYPLLLLQCGGTSLGICWHHTLGDAISTFDFINIWAKITRGIITTITPLLDRTVFHARTPPTPTHYHIEYDPPPAMNIPISPSELQSEVKTISIAVLKITFEQLKTLKAKLMKEEQPTKYTTYEILAAHIWRCSCKARNLPNDQATKLYIATDGRSRLNPPLPPEFFGNPIFTCTPIALSGDVQSEHFINTVERIRKALKQMNDVYLRSALDYLELQPDLKSLVRGPNTFRSPNLNINSWLRMPIYQADFGWGRPVVVGPANVVYEGTIYMLPSPTDDGSLTLIVRLEEKHMLLFKKLLFNSPLNSCQNAVQSKI